MKLIETVFSDRIQLIKYLKGKEVRVIIPGTRHVSVVVQHKQILKWFIPGSIQEIRFSYFDNDPNYLFLESVDKVVPAT